MRIKITSAGIFGASGEVPIGSEFDLQSAPPEGWNGRYVVVSEKSPKAVEISNEDAASNHPVENAMLRAGRKSSAAADK